MNLLNRIYKSQYSYGTKINTPFGERYITYADFIASGQPLKIIEQSIHKLVLPVYANTHTEASFTGLQTTHFREEARQIIKNSLNATDDDAVIFCGSGSTAAINKLYLRLLNKYENSEKPVTVFIGPYEHHSNVLPWRESYFELVEIPMCSKGGINLEYLENELEKRKNTHHLIGSFSAASNVTGVLSPVDDINRLLKKYNALTFWDYAGGAPYMHIDMNPGEDLNKDAIFISAHKLVGGPGTPGILVVKKHLFDGVKPVVPGGGTVQFVSKWSHGYINDIEAREEGGTPAILGAIRAGLAFKLKEDVGVDLIESIEHKYINKVISELKDIENVKILGSLELDRLSFLAFHISHGDKLIHHNLVVALLNDLFGIQSRGGCSCAGPYGHDLLQIDEDTSNKYVGAIGGLGLEGFKPGWVRLNFNYFIPEAEVDFIINAIKWIAENGWKFLNDYSFEMHSGLWTHKSGVMSTQKLSNIEFMTIQHNDEELVKPTTIFKSYINDANALSEAALINWKKSEKQEFNFTEDQKILQWFITAQDIEVDELIVK